MAKVQNPLFSFAAGGSVGKLTFSHGTDLASTAHIVRKKPRAPTTGRTSNQIACNARFSAASMSFDALPDDDRNWWLSHGEKPTKYGRAWYIAEYIIQRIDSPATPLRPVARWTAP